MPSRLEADSDVEGGGSQPPSDKQIVTGNWVSRHYIILSYLKLILVFLDNLDMFI